MANKKPTMMEMKNVVTSILMEVNQIKNAINGLDVALSRYIEYKGDKESFITHMEQEVKENESRSKESRDSSGEIGARGTGEQTSS